ncbi:alpha/beta fold hydrolase [Streptomyces diacarni]|uniref:Alpha/beta hydrolase n=1 Tax=Streptomyces diacarni TaxID=2800381 RepID=A0A367EG47_9ACTN|nr:alpha/beta fold hydrolase [Streptomyces diacarni]RCG16190.1 alpha/beta hydrolase [Streptomyces diacarni]
MNEVEELKRFVVVHARGQQIPGQEELLAGIRTDEGDAPGSWVGEWVRAGEAHERGGRLLEAGRHYAMARFPYVDGPARQDAQDRCVRVYEQWRSQGSGIERLELDLPGGRVACWAAGLDGARRAPLLVVMGGIVTVKEQWGPALTRLARQGFAALVTELPGVGENAQRYEPDSWRMLSGVLDALADRADVSQTYAMALSFSGNLALRCAAEDDRIRGIVTTGAPVEAFFTDPDWWPRVPRITVDTLAHLTGASGGALREELAGFALSHKQLSGLGIPVGYVASGRDEIIPPADPRTLAECVADCRTLELDDLHGAPHHVRETQLWCVATLLRMRAKRSVPAAVIGLLRGALAVRRRLAGAPRPTGPAG